MDSDRDSRDVTALLQAWSAGDPSARDALMPLVYQELRRQAAGQLRRERRGHTLQPTALVNEAYLRLVDQQRAIWQNRAQFFAVASQMMRRILVDRARAHKMAKRSGQWTRVTLVESMKIAPPMDVDVLDLDAALTRLAQFDLRKSQIAEHRFFSGRSGRSRRCLARDRRARLASRTRVALQGAQRGAVAPAGRAMR